MLTTARLSFAISATGDDLHLQVMLDQQMIWNGYAGPEPVVVTHDFDDSIEQDHVLEFYMQGKKPEHTVIDAAGTILQDRCIHITDLTFDNIPLAHLFTEVSRYCHDHNGTTDTVTDQFYGVMGCNGRVTMQFSTPIYLWLLEKM